MVDDKARELLSKKLEELKKKALKTSGIKLEKVKEEKEKLLDKILDIILVLGLIGGAYFIFRIVATYFIHGIVLGLIGYFVTSLFTEDPKKTIEEMYGNVLLYFALVLFVTSLFGDVLGVIVAGSPLLWPVIKDIYKMLKE